MKTTICRKPKNVSNRVDKECARNTILTEQNRTSVLFALLKSVFAYNKIGVMDGDICLRFEESGFR